MEYRKFFLEVSSVVHEQDLVTDLQHAGGSVTFEPRFSTSDKLCWVKDKFC